MRGEPVRVAFQGEAGAFSEEAVLACFGEAAVPVPRREFRDVGDAVASGAVDYGVLPVENSLVGGVVGSYDVLAAAALRVVGEVVLPIRHCLLAAPGATLEGIRRVLSHPVALGQCVRFLSARPEIEAVAVYDTAGAARDVAEAGDPAVAAVASRRAADRYGLHVLAEDLQDRADNQTRFFAVAPADRADPIAGLVGRVVAMAEVENRPGGLVRLLSPFAERGIQLTRLESRPTGVPWTYRFFLELETDTGDETVAGALAEAGASAVAFRVLGAF